MDLSVAIPELLVVYFAVGLGLLCGGAYAFVEGAQALSTRVGVPKFIIGSLVMSVATTLPEIMVSVTATFQNLESMAIGNIFGSFVANIGLVLGVAGLIRPISVNYNLLHRQMAFSIAALVLLIILSLGAYVEPVDVLVLFVLFAIWVAWVLLNMKKNSEKYVQPSLSLFYSLVYFSLGIMGMQLGAYLIIECAESIALYLGVSSYTIGLSIVAIGTSLPELASAIYAGMREEYELMLGNVIGTNILLLLFVFPSVVLLSSQPLVLSGSWGDYFFMGISSIFLWLFSARFDQSWQINRIESSILLIVFIVYQFFIYR